MKTSAEKFWFGWLKFAAIVCIFTGFFIALLNRTPVFNFMNRFITKTFYSGPELAVEIASLQSWLLGIIGAAMAGWGIAMVYLIHYPLQRKELWAWNAIVIPVLVWFLIDTTISACYEAYFNIIVNCILVLQFAAPLLFIRNSILKPKIIPA